MSGSDEFVLVEETLGKTKFQLRRDGVLGMSVTRTNADGTVVWHVPRGLFVKYAVRLVSDRVSEQLSKLLTGDYR